MKQQQVVDRDRLEWRVQGEDDQKDSGGERGDSATARRIILRGSRVGPRGRGAADDEQRLERRCPGRAHAGSAGSCEELRASALIRAEEQDEGEADGEHLLDHHHDARDLLVGQRRETEEAHGWSTYVENSGLKSKRIT